MSYRLKRKESIGEGIRRIVRQEIDTAIDHFGDDGGSLNKTAHEVRKHCKKIRGALRLVRFSFDDYGDENARFRHLARELSGIRDAHVMQATHHNLVKHISSDPPESSIAALNEVFESHTASALENVAQSLETVRVGLDSARKRVDAWSIGGGDFEAIAGGLRDSYRLAKNGLRRCRRRIEARNLHEWRKRVKYHWCHMRLLNNVWPEIIGARAVSADRLSDVLGDHHDIEVYLAFLCGVRGKETAEAVGAVQRYAGERRVTLQEASLALGTRLFAEKPKRFVERVEAYWNAWRPAARE